MVPRRFGPTWRPSDLAAILVRRRRVVDESDLLRRITVNPTIFGGKPIIRGRRLAVEHVLGMLAAGDSQQVILEGYPWLEPDDVRACLLYARRLVGHERVEPFILKTGT
jgi:uncharacterized protein (DUF433 family)